MNQIGAGELSCLDVEKGARVDKSLGGTHEGIEGDDLVAAHGLQHLHQICPKTCVEIDTLSNLVFGRRRRGQRVG